VNSLVIGQCSGRRAKPGGHRHIPRLTSRKGRKAGPCGQWFFRRLPTLPQGWVGFTEGPHRWRFIAYHGGAVCRVFPVSSSGSCRLSAVGGRAVIAEKSLANFPGRRHRLRQPWAECALRDVKTKIRVGEVRPSAAERRVLGLPKPNPPLERPFPPESNKVLLRGGAGG
jgi:hypothetical protein